MNQMEKHLCNMDAGLIPYKFKMHSNPSATSAHQKNLDW